jgi:AbrB family looped-hinge helix DNA binding protein
MSNAPKLTTTVSTKGQVILPKAIREQREWLAGTRLVVEDTEAGVLLRREPLFPSTRVQDVFGALKTERPAKTVAEMDAAVAAEARRRARD